MERRIPTKEEVLDYLQDKNKLDQKERISLARFLLQCDRVKFAQDSPTVKKRYELLQVGIDFIISTKQDEQSKDRIQRSRGLAV